MYPNLFRLNLPVIGELTITSFGAMMALAYMAGYMLIRHDLKRRGEDPEFGGDILLGALIGGILGAKIYYVLLNWELTSQDPFGMLFSRSGLVWYGGLIGAALGVILMSRLRKQPISLVADVCAPALALSYGIGRIGCFLVGDDYGRPTESWVGIAFPNGLPPTTAGSLRRNFGVSIPDSVPDFQVLAVHPTQLYETALAFLILAVLWKLRMRDKAAGWLFGAWLVLAGAERFFVEILRAKDDRFLGVFTLAQFISVLLIGLGLYFMQRLARPRAR